MHERVWRALGWLTNLLVVNVCAITAVACDSAQASDEINVDALPEVEAVAGPRIGSVDDPSSGFSLVAGVDVDLDGNIYVLEMSVPEIRVYGPAGEILRRIGRRGQGPGEFAGAPRFGIVGDTVWTVDLGMRRITLFDRQGRVLSTGSIDPLPVPLPQGYGYVFPWLMRADGLFSSHFATVAYSRN